ncbi:MAG: translocation/assembly module TamB domain-containing protein [Polyangiaceae bacterium]|nr:translocation/assembly module TamB domain-containing protein [Polyangiaceae bacterium]
MATLPSRRSSRRDPGYWAARSLCGALALVGLLPLLLALLVRLPWAQRQSAALVQRELRAALGLAAGFTLRAEILPPAVVLEGVRVDAADGTPALSAERLRVSPRVFPLLSGKLNVGDVELLRPSIKLVIAGGRPTNLTLRLPETQGSSEAPLDLKKLPLRSVAIEEARVDLALEDQGLRLLLDDLDLDVTAAQGALDLSVQLEGGQVQLRRLLDGKVLHDEDALCNLQLRAHLDEGGLLLRRFALDARADLDAAPGTAPSCRGEAPPETQLALRLNRIRVQESPGAPLPLAAGRLQLDAPLRLVRRYVPTAPDFSGEVSLLADFNFPGRPELPELKGQLLARDVQVDRLRTVVRTLDAQVEAGGGEVRIPLGKATYGDGDVTIRNARAQLFARGIPVAVDEVALQNIRFPALMRDVGITRHTIVEWNLERGAFVDFKGLALDPDKGGPSLMGDIWVQTEGFELGDKGWDDPRRRRVVAVSKARVKGRFGVERYGILFRQMTADFGRSHLDVPAVTIGFEDKLEVQVARGTRIELADISPVSNLAVGGRMEIQGGVCCLQSDPKVEGDLSVSNLQMAGLPLADLATAHAVFKPFLLELSRVQARKSHALPDGKRSSGSEYQSERIRVDFDRPQGLLVEGNVATKAMDFRDLLDIFLFEKDPRFQEITGTGAAQAHLRFDVGGPGDPCRSGAIYLRSRATMNRMVLYGERYDGGEAELDFRWLNRPALERGMEVDLHAVTLRKGRGVISGAGVMRRGASVEGHFLAQDVPMANVDAFGDLGRAVDGSISAAGKIRGVAQAPEIDADVRLSPVRVGQKMLPPSSFKVTLVPDAPAPPSDTSTGGPCKEPIPQPFNQEKYARDERKGMFHMNGELFGGQLRLNDVQTSWQRAKEVSGELLAENLDLGALVQISPAVALSEQPPSGKLTGRLLIERMELEHLERSRLRFSARDLELRRGSTSIALKIPRGMTSVGGRVDGDTLELDRMSFGVRTNAGIETELGLSGRVSSLSTDRKLDLEVRLAPIDIGAILAQVPRVDAAAGLLEGSVAIQGTASDPAARGELRLRNGAIALQGAPLSLDEIDLLARIDEQEIRVVNAMARAGGGQLQLSARAPLRGLSVAEVSAQLEARGVRLPVSEGVEMVADASLGAAWTPPAPDGPRRKTRLTGSVTLQNFLYTRPIGVAADLDALARKGKRTEVAVYDPEEDLLDLSIRVFSPRPLVFRNNLLEADVSLDSSLLLTGTNQRFGLQGLLRLNPGGRLRLRSNEFDIRQGTIRFDDPLRVTPRVDLQASTEYRRVTTSAAAGPAGAGPGAGAAAGASAGAGAGGTAGAGGLWRILMHAYGDADNLKLDLSSDPNLAQEDIILLLTIGMTRAELDQLQASNLGSTAALEALSALSGADRAVKTVIPILDDFRLGSAYSPRTGRTEPTVTVGKRISNQLRANVITGLSENRDVRSNIEWRITPGTSLLGNYDNLSDVASRGLGNLGADFRVRLEF